MIRQLPVSSNVCCLALHSRNQLSPEAACVLYRGLVLSSSPLTPPTVIHSLESSADPWNTSEFASSTELEGSLELILHPFMFVFGLFFEAECHYVAQSSLKLSPASAFQVLGLQA
jgi:hypothetical protein